MSVLENLVALQQCELEIRALESRLNKIPREMDDLEKEVATERANLKSAEDRLSASQKARRTLEGELELLEERITKYKDQLMQVKSNEEYRAMQKQIQAARDEISSKEDMILVKMEEAETLQAELAQRQRELDQGLVRVHQLEAELEEEARRLRAELDDRRRRREQVRRTVPEELLDQYERIAGARGGIAVAEARNEHCQQCNVRLRPQVYQLLLLGSSIQRCDNCSRILYIKAPEAGEQPQPAGG